MDIINAHIVDYLLSVTPDRDSVLDDMEEYALARNFPIVGPLVGRFLYSIAKAIDARRVLELGSGFGYSAYWFAKAIARNGKVICTESDPDNVEHAQAYLQRGKLAGKVEFITGDALKLIDEIDGPFDIIFNDVDKHQYPRVFRKALPKLRKGGLLLSDNVLWSGRILQDKPDSNTAGILTYNRLVYSSKDLFTTIIPLRDGVSLSVKL